MWWYVTDLSLACYAMVGWCPWEACLCMRIGRVKHHRLHGHTHIQVGERGGREIVVKMQYKRKFKKRKKKSLKSESCLNLVSGKYLKKCLENYKCHATGKYCYIYIYVFSRISIWKNIIHRLFTTRIILYNLRHSGTPKSFFNIILILWYSTFIM